MKEQHLVEIVYNRRKEFSDKTLLRGKSAADRAWTNTTWDAFVHKMENVGKALIKEGVRHQDNVLIFSQNMPEWVVCDMGIMSAGGVTVPVYATNAPDQVTYIAKETEAKVMFVGEQEQLDKTQAIISSGDYSFERIVVFDEDLHLPEGPYVHFKQWISEEASAEVEAEFLRRQELHSGEDLATIIYTSGTTGEPKGVMLGHDNLIKMMSIHEGKIAVSSEDVSLAFLPLSHVFERGWTLYCLHKGMEIAMLSNPKKILEALAEVRPTVMCSVPRLYEKVYHKVLGQVEDHGKLKERVFNWAMKQGEKRAGYINRNEKAPRSVRTKARIADRAVFKKIRQGFGGRMRLMPVGGAPISKEVVSFFHSIGLPLRIGYGLTETCATVTCFEQHGFRIGSVGNVMPEVEIKIGEEDEILIKGKTVMRGYYKKPEETAKVFTEDGWFKTGDAGKFDVDGNLYITDRIKDLMKTSGGKYIAPQMIESRLTNDTYIEQAVVVGDQKPYVTAFLVPNFEALRDYATSIDINFQSMEELINMPKIQEFYDQKVMELQQGLANFEKVKKFTILPREFSMDSGELTPTLKIKRKVILDRLDDMIMRMYALNKQ